MPNLSVVLPAFNEEEVIEKTFARLEKTLEGMLSKKIVSDFEVLFINDGSTDRTWEIIAELNKKNPHFKGISLSRNFGLEAAYTAGLFEAKGDFVVMSDCDLQDPPEVIEAMLLKAVESGADVVLGKRTKRNEGLLRKMLMNLFHRIFSKMNSTGAPSDVGNFSLLSRKALNAILRLNEKTRYLPGIRHYAGFKQAYVEYEREDRAAGEAKMSYRRLFNYAMDALFSFSAAPVRFCWKLGFLGVFASVALAVFVFLQKFVFKVATVGWSSTILTIVFLSSIQMLFLGIMGEYIYRIYRETQNRPIYFIDEQIGFEKASEKKDRS